MTRKDFQFIAETLAATLANVHPEDRTSVINLWKRALQTQNPRFDAERFEAAVIKAGSRAKIFPWNVVAIPR
jgi:hypothetical protein